MYEYHLPSERIESIESIEEKIMSSTISQRVEDEFDIPKPLILLLYEVLIQLRYLVLNSGLSLAYTVVFRVASGGSNSHN